MFKYLLRLCAEQVQLLWLHFRFPQVHLTCRDTEYLSGGLAGEGRASQEAAVPESRGTRPRGGGKGGRDLCPVPGSGRGALPGPAMSRRGIARPRRRAPPRGRGSWGEAAGSARRRETGNLPFWPSSRSS